MVAADWPYYLINSCDVVRIIVNSRHICRGDPLPRDVANNGSPVPILVNRSRNEFAVTLKPYGYRAVGVKRPFRLCGNPRPHMGATYDAPAHPSWYTTSVDAHSKETLRLALLKTRPPQ